MIEPNPTYRDLFYRHLSRAGYTVDVTGSSEAALHTLRNSPFPAEWDMILMDGKIAETLNREMVQFFLEMRYITPTVLMVMIKPRQGENDIRFGFEDCLIEKPIKWSPAGLPDPVIPAAQAAGRSGNRRCRAGGLPCPVMNTGRSTWPRRWPLWNDFPI